MEFGKRQKVKRLARSSGVEPFYVCCHHQATGIQQPVACSLFYNHHLFCILPHSCIYLYNIVACRQCTYINGKFRCSSLPAADNHISFHISNIQTHSSLLLICCWHNNVYNTGRRVRGYAELNWYHSLTNCSRFTPCS